MLSKNSYDPILRSGIMFAIEWMVIRHTKWRYLFILEIEIRGLIRLACQRIGARNFICLWRCICVCVYVYVDWKRSVPYPSLEMEKVKYRVVVWRRRWGWGGGGVGKKNMCNKPLTQTQNKLDVSLVWTARADVVSRLPGPSLNPEMEKITTRSLLHLQQYLPFIYLFSRYVVLYCLYGLDFSIVSFLG